MKSAPPEDAAPGRSAPAAPLGYDPGWSDHTWTGDAPPEPLPTPWPRRVLAWIRGAGFLLATAALLPPFFLARALGGRLDRRVAAWWCLSGARLSGLRLRRIGAPMSSGALLVNHASWLDIMVIGAVAPVHFVAKAEIESWPMFGWIGKISNTVFIARRRAEAKAQEALLSERARRGELLCLFPEGTSSDGRRVLPFKSSLFSMFYAEDGAPSGIAAQPVTVHYQAPPGEDPRFYGWWGRMPLFPHVLAALRHPGGVATVIFHEPIEVERLPDRKALAAEAERMVRAGLELAEAGAPRALS